MKVLKFGGTSVGTVNSLKNVKSIVEGCDERVIVVVSALGGITDKLITTAKLAAKGDSDYLTNYNEITERHYAIIEGLVPECNREEITFTVSSLLEELGKHFPWCIAYKRLVTTHSRHNTQLW